MEVGHVLGASRSQTAGYQSATTLGTTVTAPGAANSKGAWTAITVGFGFPCAALMIDLQNEPGSGDSVQLVDIGYGGSGAQVVIVPNLLMTRPTSVIGSRSKLLVPVGFGTDNVWARYQSSGTAPVLTAQLTAFGDPGMPLGAPPMMFDDYGTTTGSSKGTDVDPGGTANTKGSWVSLGTTTYASRSIIVQAAFYQSMTGNSVSGRLDLAMDVSGTKTILLADHPFGTVGASGSATVTAQPSIWLPLSIPAGAALYARTACNINTATSRVPTVSVLGGR